MKTAISITALVVALVGAGPALAQGTSEGFVIGDATFVVGVDDNFLAGGAGSEQLRDIVYVIVPGSIGYQSGRGRTLFTAAYQPEFEVFHDNSGLNSWNHSAGVRLQTQRGRNLDLYFGGSFLYTEDAGRNLTGSLVVLPRGTYMEAFGTAGMGYRLGRRTTLTIDVTNTYIDDSARFNFSTGDSFDQTRNTLAAAVGLGFRIGNRHTLNVGYTYSDVRLTDIGQPATPGTTALRSDDQSGVAGGYTYATLRNFRLSMSGGIVFLVNDQRRWTAAARAQKAWRSFGVGGGYTRTTTAFRSLTNPNLLDPTGGGVPVRGPELFDSLIDSLELDFNVDLRQKVLLTTGARATRTAANVFTPEVTTISANLNAEFFVSERWRPFASVAWFNQDQDVFGVPSGTRMRYVAGFRFGWFTGPRARNDGDRIASVLPNSR